jgi:hypothetical protein
MIFGNFRLFKVQLVTQPQLLNHPLPSSMSTQGSSGIEIVDLTEDESLDFQAPASLSTQDEGSSQEMRNVGVSAGEEALDLGASSDIEEIFMENAVIDAETRQRNIDRRRERLLATGIDEDALTAAANARDPGLVEEIIVISDDEAEEDRFAAERRNRRRQRIWEDEREPARHRGMYDSFTIQVFFCVEDESADSIQTKRQP